MRPTDKGKHYNGMFKHKFNGEVYLVVWCPKKKCYSFTVIEPGKGPKAKQKGEHFYHVREHVKYLCVRLPKAVEKLKYEELVNQKKTEVRDE